MKKQILYGMLGFLSLLGFAGVFTEARGFLGFFAFAVDFQYFFLKSDEMLEAQLARSASRAFVVGMLMMAAAVLGTLTLGGFTPQRALLTGCTVGWAASVVSTPDRRLVRLPGELGLDRDPQPDEGAPGPSGPEAGGAGKAGGGPAGDHRKPGKGAVQPLSGAGLEHRQGVRGAH